MTDDLPGVSGRLVHMNSCAGFIVRFFPTNCQQSIVKIYSSGELYWEICNFFPLATSDGLCYIVYSQDVVLATQSQWRKEVMLMNTSTLKL